MIYWETANNSNNDTLNNILTVYIKIVPNNFYEINTCYKNIKTYILIQLTV